MVGVKSRIDRTTCISTPFLSVYLLSSPYLSRNRFSFPVVSILLVLPLTNPGNASYLVFQFCLLEEKFEILLFLLDFSLAFLESTPTAASLTLICLSLLAVVGNWSLASRRTRGLEVKLSHLRRGHESARKLQVYQK